MASIITEWLAEDNRVAVSLATALLLAVVAGYCWWPSQSDVPTLTGAIPRISITYLYMTDMRTFLSRAKKALREKKIVRSYLGPATLYLVEGAQHVQALFRTSTSVSSDIFILLIQQHLWGSTKEDLAKFANDKSGRLKTPAPGTEGRPDEERYWAGLHNVIHNYLARSQETNKLADSYQRFFGQRLDQFRVGQEATVLIYDFLCRDMTSAAITAINGERVLAKNPELIKLLWDFDEIAASLVWGLPKWLNAASWKKRDRLRGAFAAHLKSAMDEFDWSRDDDPDWDPIFGSRFTRELVKWMRETGFAFETIGGAVVIMTVFGSNANTVPVATWCVMEAVKDQALLKAVRDEVMTAYETDPVSGQKTINAQALLSLPLLQSIYTEALRLHVSINITREVVGPISLGGVNLERGAIIQAPTEISHLGEEVWGAEGHPAKEFWAERHIKYEEVVDENGKAKTVRQFSVAGRSNDLYPYGGGVSICPGRFFAKQEIMLTVAMLVSHFDIEFVEWVRKEDGTTSDRPAEDDEMVRRSLGAARPRHESAFQEAVVIDHISCFKL